MAKYRLKENISFDGEVLVVGTIVDTDSIAISGDSLTLWGWAELIDDSVASDVPVHSEDASEADPVEPPKRRKK